MKLRTGFDPDENLAVSKASELDTGEETVTQQHFGPECDINEIVRRFGLTGEMPQNFRMPLSAEFLEVTDFHSAMNAIKAAEQSFMSLPAHLRERFKHDPQELMAFLEDDKNREEAEKLGLVNKAPEKTRDVVAAVDELAAKLAPAGVVPKT